MSRTLKVILNFVPLLSILLSLLPYEKYGVSPICTKYIRAALAFVGLATIWAVDIFPVVGLLTPSGLAWAGVELVAFIFCVFLIMRHH